MERKFDISEDTNKVGSPRLVSLMIFCNKNESIENLR
jgi:hypothetical protein